MATKIVVYTEVNVRGPWIQGTGGTNPIMRRFFADAKKRVTEVGTAEVRARISKSAKHPTGKFAGAIVTRDFAKGRTVLAEYPQVLRGPWLEGTSERNASTGFKGYRAFRLTRNRLRKDLTAIIQADLDRAVAQLNGGG